jgi:hypothetical protein
MAAESAVMFLCRPTPCGCFHKAAAMRACGMFRQPGIGNSDPEHEAPRFGIAHLFR